MGGKSEILLEIFFARWWKPVEEWFWRFESFSKLKTTFCKYLTWIKIKISMNCVKEYESKTKMVQEQWLQLKMFLLGYNLKTFVCACVRACVRGMTFGGEGKKLWRGESSVGRTFPGGGVSKFLAGGGTSPPSPSRENPAELFI